MIDVAGCLGLTAKEERERENDSEPLPAIECGQCAGFDGDDCIIEGSPRFRKKTMNHWKGCGKFKQADASCFEE